MKVLLIVFFYVAVSQGCFPIRRKSLSKFEHHLEQCKNEQDNEKKKFSADEWWNCVDRYSEKGQKMYEANLNDTVVKLVQPKDESNNYHDVKISAYSATASFTKEMLRKFDNNDIRVSVVITEKLSVFPNVPNETKVILASHIKGYGSTTLNDSYSIHYNTESIKKKYQDKDIGVKFKIFQEETRTWTEEERENICETSHVTRKLAYFAIIVNQTPMLANKELSMLTLITCSLSSIGLFLTVVIYVVIEELRCRRSTYYLANICVCLLAVNLIFLFGINRTDITVPCYVVAALLHFFLLASWFWMSANAYSMYYFCVRVVRVANDSLKKVATAVSYIGSLAITLLTLGIGYFYMDEGKTCLGSSSKYRSSKVCWLDNGSLKYGFLAPVAIIFVPTFYWFLAVVSHAICHRKQIPSNQGKRTQIQNFMIAFCLIVITGMSWIFGFLLLLSTDRTYRTILSWLFTITTCSQGVFIFLIHCCRKKSIRDLWLTRHAGRPRSSSHFYVDTTTMERNIRQRRGMSLARDKKCTTV